MTLEQLSSVFIFVTEPVFTGNPQIKRSILSDSIQTKEELLDKLAHDLSFPGYFGQNWDALYDCLLDFYWFGEDTSIEIIHRALPSLADKELAIYLDILADAIKVWQEHGQDRLRVFFPDILQDRIESLLMMKQRQYESGAA